MGLWNDVIFPRLLHRVMQNPEALRQREAVIPAATGRTLEIGMGSGLNLPLYGPEILSVTGLDPSDTLLAMAGRVERGGDLEVELIPGQAEAMPFDDMSFDSVVSTWTLCSVDDPAAVMEEIRRVLKPAGRLVFVEHGRAPAASTGRWQDRLTPLWRKMAGNCHLNRDMVAVIGGAGFDLEGASGEWIEKIPRILSWQNRGVAVRI